MDKILAQDEVDALLRGLSGGELETETDIPEESRRPSGLRKTIN